MPPPLSARLVAYRDEDCSVIDDEWLAFETGTARDSTGCSRPRLAGVPEVGGDGRSAPNADRRREAGRAPCGPPPPRHPVRLLRHGDAAVAAAAEGAAVVRVVLPSEVERDDVVDLVRLVEQIVAQGASPRLPRRDALLVVPAQGTTRGH
jgi:hypothetical protein